MKVAAIQMVSGIAVEENLQAASTLVEQAAQQQCELVVLPEHFCLLGAHDTDKLSIAEAFGQGLIQRTLSDLALKYGLWIVGGSLPLRSHLPDRALNTCLVFNPQGNCVVRYDKMHLFSFDNGKEHYDEARVLIPGDQPTAFELPSRDGHSWQVALSICYDLRFPELYRSLHPDLLLVPSAFTYTTGQAHWELLLRARAIENLAYVVAPAQGGQHQNGRKTWGHSMIIDGWGHILAEHAQGAAVVVSDLHWSTLEQYRQQLPALQHRRTLPAA
jgi:deaminated glutathione amidase